METKPSKPQIPLYIGIGFLLCLILVELLLIIWRNDGLLVYTLDDPYIHMALGENIKGGHYGINDSEFSSPSSSILWPFITAPFSAYEYAPFLFNVVFAIATVIVLVKILNISFDFSDKYTRDVFNSAIVILFILAINIVGLLYTGMEHSLQVLLVLVVAYGLIVTTEKKEIKWWLLAAIIVAPLVRYECMAISIAALFYIAMRGHFKLAVFAMVSISVFFGSFTVFLTSLGLDPFPTSVSVKSSVVGSGGTLYSILSNLARCVSNRQGVVLSVGMLALVSFYIFSRQNVIRKQLAVITVFAVCMHFIGGRCGWYNRYEIYIWSFMLLIVMYIFAPSIKKFVVDKGLATSILVAAGFVIITGKPYIDGLFSLSIAANNIYEQQYQMHRFAVDYYRMPVAVNDLGYVSYKNDNYVLDLWGLGSKKALNCRLDGSRADWMKNISDEANIGLVMIYEDWFKKIPDEWIKIGELHLGKQKITPACSRVAFYATNQSVSSYIVRKLYHFSKTLPVGVKFIFKKGAANKTYQ